MIYSHSVLAVLAVGTASSVLAAPIVSNALPGDSTLENVAPTLSSSSSLPIHTDSAGNSHRSSVPTTIEPVLGPQPTAPSTNFGDGSSSAASQNPNSHTNSITPTSSTIHQPRAANESQKEEDERQLQQLRDSLKKSKGLMTVSIQEEIEELEKKMQLSHGPQQTVTQSFEGKEDVPMGDAHSPAFDVHMHGASYPQSLKSQPDTEMGGVHHGSPMSLDPPSPPAHQPRSDVGPGQLPSTNSHIPSPYRARSLSDLYGDDLD
ncbi:MAG: hypothetical protein NXY57DRAFT_775683 [Lentinula lateritia]|nr:MAG: hypothetical protein NXY57DRAFT_775683 [Lentinula lateritia]